jgi:transcription initiation factor TFIIIB Brf1 subunit/transcription initiation factor TFIIB
LFCSGHLSLLKFTKSKKIFRFSIIISLSVKPDFDLKTKIYFKNKKNELKNLLCVISTQKLSFKVLNNMDYEDIYVDDFEGITEAFKNTLFKAADEECKHPNITEFLDGRGYCIDCGVIFENSKDSKSECKHEKVAKDDNTGVDVCRTCGKELESLDFSQEWRYFGSSDNRSTQDPSRCRKPKVAQKTIKNYFQNKPEEFKPAIIKRVEVRYDKVIKVSGENLLRGKGRKAIIAVCLFYALQDDHQYRTLDHVKKIFKVEQKDMSSALTRYYEAFPEDKNRHMTPQKLLRWVMEKTNTDMIHYRRIMLISEYFTSTSSLIERSNPQSVAASTIYFYLEYFSENCKDKTNKVKFADDADLSDITVSKIYKEMKRISSIAADDYRKAQ